MRLPLFLGYDSPYWPTYVIAVRSRSGNMDVVVNPASFASDSQLVDAYHVASMALRRLSIMGPSTHPRRVDAHSLTVSHKNGPQKGLFP